MMREWIYPTAILVVVTVVLSVGAPKASRAQPREYRWLGVLNDMLIGADGRWSTSKTMFTIWTYAVSLVLLSILFLHDAAGLSESGLDGSYLFLLGFPVGSAVLAKQITVSAIANGDLFKDDGTPSTNPLIDLTGDDAGRLDLGDFQYVLFNAIGVAYFLYLYHHAPVAGLPKLPSTVILLISVSAVAYLGKKALASTTGPVITSYGPPHAAAGASIVVNARLLIDADKPLDDPSTLPVVAIFTPLQGSVENVASEWAVPYTGALTATADLTVATFVVPALPAGAYNLRLANYLGVRSDPKRFAVP